MKFVMRKLYLLPLIALFALVLLAACGGDDKGVDDGGGVGGGHGEAGDVPGAEFVGDWGEAVAKSCGEVAGHGLGGRAGWEEQPALVGAGVGEAEERGECARRNGAGVNFGLGWVRVV